MQRDMCESVAYPCLSSVGSRPQLMTEVSMLSLWDADSFANLHMYLMFRLGKKRTL
jgi:hypothetical protein